VVREQVAGTMADPFGPLAVSLREGQQAKDPIEEGGVEAVPRGRADLPKPVERVPAPVPERPRSLGARGDDQRCELVDRAVIKELGLGIELLGERPGPVPVRGEAPEMAPAEPTGQQTNQANG